MKPPKITPEWLAGGWELEQGHVPGSYRMLGIWALSGLASVAATQVGARLGDLHAGMYAGAGIGTLGILAGAALYRRCERAFTLPDTGPWTDDLPTPARLTDHLTVEDADPTTPADPDDIQQLDPVPAPAFDTATSPAALAPVSGVRRGTRTTPATRTTPVRGRWSA